MIRITKTRVCRIIAAGLLLACITNGAYAQLLFESGMEEENYAKTSYNPYGRSQITRSSNPRYDNFGNFIINGVNLFYWNEEKWNSRHVQTSERYSNIDKVNPIDGSPYFNRYLNNLVVMSETNESFSSRFMVGNEIRVYFSPLTVDMAALNGIRWDMDFAGNQLTLISSRASAPLWDLGEIGRVSSTKDAVSPAYLTGGHIERNVGIFNISANYVNTYRSNSVLSRKQNSITGTLLHDNPATGEAFNKPLQIAVKVEDESRFDGGGPKLYDIYIIINGKIRREMLTGISKGNWQDDFNVHKKLDDPNRDLFQNRYFLDPLRAPDFFTINNVKNTKELQDTKTNVLSDRGILAKRFSTSEPEFDFRKLNKDSNEYLECNGEDYLIFWFDLPADEDVQEVKFKALVSNNYGISTAEIYKNQNGQMTSSVKLGKAEATFFDKVIYSKGDIKDGSNLQWVSFEHGIPTANMLMSFRIKSNIKGFKFVSEYSNNLQYKQFNNDKSKKFSKSTDAYYVNVMKEIGLFTLGGEYFKMSPDYQTQFRHIDAQYKDYDDHYGSYFALDPTQRGNKIQTGGFQQVLNFTNLITTVDDNDDKDQYPDFHILPYLRDQNGIFPGQDKNGNYRPDVNENDNLIPDYAEPFILYNADPDEYEYGIDLNNNNQIDDREDDDKPDYPYDLDRKGYHLFGTYGQNEGWKYTLGYYNNKTIMAGGKSDVRYGNVEYNKFIPFFANVRFAATVKKTEDTIEDNIFKLARRNSMTQIDSLTYGYNTYDGSTIIEDTITEKYYDQLQYQNSYVNTSYFETNIFNVPNLNIGVKIKYDLNHQNKTNYQNTNNIVNRSQVYKADYKLYIKKMIIQPQIKYMYNKYTNDKGYYKTIHEEYLYPIIKAEYPLTVKTRLLAGAQGIPGLNASYKNYVYDQFNYDMRDYVIMLSNRSVYQGHDFILNVGYQTSWKKYYGVVRESYNRTDKVYFVRFIIGVQPIS